jgi:hypothetical protein
MAAIRTPQDELQVGRRGYQPAAGYGAETTVPDWEKRLCLQRGSGNVDFAVSGTKHDALKGYEERR